MNMPVRFLRANSAYEITLRYVVLSGLWFLAIESVPHLILYFDVHRFLIDLWGDVVFVAISSVLLWYGLYKRNIAHRAVEDSLRALFDDSPLVHCLVDPQTLSFVDANPSAVKFYGYPYERFIKFKITDINTLSGADIAPLIASVVAREKQILRFKHRLASGAIKDVVIIYEPIVSYGRKLLLTTVFDDSERIHAEMTLERSNRLLRATTAGLRVAAVALEREALAQSLALVLADDGGYPGVSILDALQRPGEPVRPLAVVGADALIYSKMRVTWDQTAGGAGPTGRAIRTGQLQVVADIARDETTKPWAEYLDKYGFCSMVAMPIEVRGQVNCVLCLFAKDVDAFGPHEQELIKLLANDFGKALTGIEAEVQLKDFDRQRQQALGFAEGSIFSLVETLSLALEARDRYTVGHQNRVAWLACEMGRRLKLSDDRLTGLRIGALLHDIGKIAIPAEILSKPGALSEEERALVRTHAKVGREILAGVTFPWPIQRIIGEHHERLDGSGYPDGLKGSSICYEAKIVAVADTVEAIFGRRPYREALGMTAAVSALTQSRGIQLDAEVVDVCLAVLKDYGNDWMKRAVSNTNPRRLQPPLQPPLQPRVLRIPALGSGGQGKPPPASSTSPAHADKS